MFITFSCPCNVNRTTLIDAALATCSQAWLLPQPVSSFGFAVLAVPRFTSRFFFFSFLTVRKVAKTEAHLQATLRPEREREEALRALPLEGRQGEHVLAEVCRHVCGMWWVGSTVLRTFSLTAIFVQ